MMTYHQATAVLVANTINVSIFQQAWLIDNEILSRDEASGEKNLFSPMAVNVFCPDFSLLVIPERIQIIVSDGIPNAGNIFTRIFSKIAECLPHTPIKALGFNFDSAIPISQPDRFFSDHRNKFISESNPLSGFFRTNDSRYGFYASMDAYGGRLRLDLKPVTKGDAESLLLRFNHHNEINSMEALPQILERWGDIFNSVDEMSKSADDSLTQ